MSAKRTWRWVDDEPADAAIDWLLEDAMPRKSIGFLAAASGRGKTFLAIDLMLSLARGKPFFGRAMKAPGGSYLVAGEGGYGVTHRVRAALAHKFGGDGAPLAFDTDPADFLRVEHRRTFIDRLRHVDAGMQERYSVPLRMIVFDTFARCFAIKDENDARSVSAATLVMAEIAEELGVAVMAVHHFGKDESAGMRGSSALRANADFVLSVPRKGKLVLEKCRDAPEGHLGSFTLRTAPGIATSNGRPVAYVAVGDHGEEFEDVTKLTTAGVLAACIKAALSEEGEPRMHPDNHSLVPAVRARNVRQRFYSQWGGSGPARRQAWARAIRDAEDFRAFPINGEQWLVAERDIA